MTHAKIIIGNFNSNREANVFILDYLVLYVALTRQVSVAI